MNRRPLFILSSKGKYVLFGIPTKALFLVIGWVWIESLPTSLGVVIVEIVHFNYRLFIDIIFADTCDKVALMADTDSHNFCVIITDSFHQHEIVHVPYSNKGIDASCYKESVTIVYCDSIALAMVAVYHFIERLSWKCLSIENSDCSCLIRYKQELPFSLVPLKSVDIDFIFDLLMLFPHPHIKEREFVFDIWDPQKVAIWTHR